MRAAGEVQVQAGSEAGVADTIHRHCQVSCQGGPSSASSEELEEFQQEADLLSSLISFFLLFSLSSESGVDCARAS